MPGEVRGLNLVDGGAGAGAGANATDAGEADVAANKNSTESNKLDDDVADRTHYWMNRHYDIKDINETDPIYGHKVFKDEMNRFLPYHAKKPINKRW